MNSPARRFGVVGDIHGDFDALNRAMTGRPDVTFWLSVGDVASDDMRYPTPAAPLYWIQGNNEDFDLIARAGDGVRPTGRGLGVNLHFLSNATAQAVDGVRVAALGGTFAPTWYETPAAELPFPRYSGPVKVRDDKRRHFVREQVEACKAMTGIDVLLTHEAPRPFIVVAGGRRIDAGKAAINEVLGAMKPRLHFFGHHHRFSHAVREGVVSIGLDLVSQSYVVVDAASFEWTKHEPRTKN